MGAPDRSVTPPVRRQADHPAIQFGRTGAENPLSVARSFEPLNRLRRVRLLTVDERVPRAACLVGAFLELARTR